MTHIKNTVVLTNLTFRHIQCLHLMYVEVAWVLVSLGTQVQLPVILDPDYLPDYQTIFPFLKACYRYIYKIFIFSPNDSPSKSMKNFLFHLKSSFRSPDIQTFLFSPLPFHTLQTQKDKLKWNKL